MSGKHPKTTDSLMRYLRDQKGIAINGSFQKRKLMNIGYYHGYKGYRYINKATNVIPYTSFDELTAVYEFDSQLKALFYPFVMQIETALKNYVLETVVGTVNSDSLSMYIANSWIIIKCSPHPARHSKMLKTASRLKIDISEN